MQHMPKIHPIKLIARENDDVFVILLEDIVEVLPHGIGGALIPMGAARGLSSRQDLHEPTREPIERITLVNVPMERRGIKLRQDVHEPDVGVDAIADGNVHQPVFSSDRHSRLGPLLRQRKQSLAFASAQNHAQHVVRRDSLHSRGRHTRNFIPQVLAASIDKNQNLG